MSGSAGSGQKRSALTETFPPSFWSGPSTTRPGRADDEGAVLLEEVGPDDGLHDPALVLERQEHEALRRPRPLPHDDGAGGLHAVALARVAQLGRREDGAGRQKRPQVLDEVRPGRHVRRAVVGRRLLDGGHLGKRGILRRGRKRKIFIERPERAGDLGHLPERGAAGDAEGGERARVGESASSRRGAAAPALKSPQHLRRISSSASPSMALPVASFSPLMKRIPRRMARRFPSSPSKKSSLLFFSLQPAFPSRRVHVDRQHRTCRGAGCPSRSWPGGRSPSATRSGGTP